jgi:hypothetical protein
LPVTVNLGVMVLNSISVNSGIFYGENVQNHWESMNKLNTALLISGANDRVFKHYNMVYDTDIFDQLINHVNIEAAQAPAILKE